MATLELALRFASIVDHAMSGSNAGDEQRGLGLPAAHIMPGSLFIADDRKHSRSPGALPDTAEAGLPQAGHPAFDPGGSIDSSLTEAKRLSRQAVEVIDGFAKGVEVATLSGRNEAFDGQAA